MIISILGGTGNIGKGFALRWSKKHEVIIGSRTQEKAQAAAAEYNAILKERNLEGNIRGTDNKSAAATADVVLLAIRYEHIPSVIELISPVLDKQILISVVVPMTRDSCYIHNGAQPVKIHVDSNDYNANFFCYTRPQAGSAAKEIANLLPAGIELTGAFHNVPAKKLADLDIDLDYDIPVSGNNMYSKNIVFGLVRDIPNMRPLDVGPIEASAMIESLTPLVINLAAKNNLKDLGIKFV